MRAAVQGHSLGGCLGSLLMLMFVHRKVIPPLNIGPVYTFGAPAVFAEADASVYGEQVRPLIAMVHAQTVHRCSCLQHPEHAASNISVCIMCPSRPNSMLVDSSGTPYSCSMLALPCASGRYLALR